MAKSTRQTSIAVASASSAAYGSIGELSDLTMGALTRDRIDVTNLSSTDDIRSYIAGFIDLGEVTMTLNYDADLLDHSGSTTLGLANLLTAGSTVWWQVVPHGSTAKGVKFKGYVSNFAPQFSVGDAAKCDVSIQMTTLPTYIASTGT